MNPECWAQITLKEVDVQKTRNVGLRKTEQKRMSESGMLGSEDRQGTGNPECWAQVILRKEYQKPECWAQLADKGGLINEYRREVVS